MAIFPGVLKSVLVAAVMASSAFTLPALAAGTAVDVQLWDKGADAEMTVDMGMNMGGDLQLAPMGVAMSSDSIAAGEITFNVTNVSKDEIHEMIIAPLANANATLPYDEAMAKVDEDGAGHLGEVSELEPGAAGSLTLTLQPGEYIAYCNIPGHYASGMWVAFTVK